MNDRIPAHPMGPACFVTISLTDSESPVLLDEFDRLRAAVRRTWREQPFFAHAWVVLPGRMHCVWSLPAGDNALAPRWGAIKRRFERADDIGPGIWQPGWSARRIASIAEYGDCVRYCWFAPVRQGVARRPEDWAYSSIHADETDERQVA